MGSENTKGYSKKSKAIDNDKNTVNKSTLELWKLQLKALSNDKKLQSRQDNNDLVPSDEMSEFYIDDELHHSQSLENMQKD